MAQAKTLYPPCKARPVSLEPGLSVGAAFERIAGACLEHITGNQRGFLESDDIEYAHQMRVGIRRLRSALDLFAPQGLSPALVACGEELRWLGNAMGATRDWDVFISRTLPRMAENSGLAATLPGLVVAARAICQRHRAEARLWVASRRYDDLIRQLRLLVAEAGKSEALATPIGEVAGRLLEKRQRKLLSRARGLMRLSAEKRHRVRIAGKKLRYASEFFVSLFHGEPALVYIKGLEGVQEILGSLNDNAVTASLLKELGLAVRRDPALYPAVTEMRRGLPELRRDLLKRLGSTWKAFSCHKPFWKV